MASLKRGRWYHLLAAGLFFISAGVLLGRFYTGSPGVRNTADGFCLGLGITLVLGSLVKAKLTARPH